MAETRREGRPRGQTRGSTLRRPVLVQQSDLVDSLQSSPPKTFTQLSNQFARFLRFATQVFVRGVTGGQGRYGRWNKHGDFIESDKIREDGDDFIVDADLKILGKLTLENDESICWEDAAGVETELLRLEPDDDFHIYDDAIIIDGPTGNVGIGADPSHNLDVGGDGIRRLRVRSTDDFAAVRIQGVSGNFEMRQSGTNFIFRDITAGRNVFQIDSDGNVEMLGTVSTLRLHVVTETQRDAIPNPVRGDLVYVSDGTNEARYECYFERNGAGTGVWLPFQEFPSFALGTHTGPTTTTIATVNVFVRLQGVLTEEAGTLFATFATVGGGSEITYTGPNRVFPVTIEYNGSAEKVGGGVPRAFAMEIRVNGTPVGFAKPFTTRQNEPSEFATAAYVALQNGDVISLFVENQGNNDNLQINSYQFLLTGT